MIAILAVILVVGFKAMNAVVLCVLVFGYMNSDMAVYQLR